MRAWEFNRFGRGASGILVPKLVGRRERPFSVIQIFADGSEGFWLNSNVDQNHYQEDTGLTEAGDTDTLGLILSQAQGALGNLGPELATNGTFDSTDDWDLGTGWTITGGEAVGEDVPGGGTGELGHQTAQGEPFAAYRFLWEMVERTSGALFARINFTNGSTEQSTGEKKNILIAGASEGPFAFRRGISDFTGVIDNASCRKVPGHHFHQPSTPSRPRREQGSDGNWFYRLDGSDDFAEAPAAHFEPPFVLAGVFAVDGTDADQTFMSGTDAGSNSAQLYYAHSAGAIGIYNGSTPVLEVTVGQQPISPVVVVAVVDGANSELYVGDTIETGTLGTRVVDLGTFRLGRRQFDASQHHHGRAWQPFGINRRLSISEIQNLKSKLRSLSPANP